MNEVNAAFKAVGWVCQSEKRERRESGELSEKNLTLLTYSLTVTPVTVTQYKAVWLQ